MRKAIEAVTEEARAHFTRSRGSHGWDHTERVRSLALHIGRREGADLEILEMAALLHDIGRHREDESLGEVCHAKEGARLARSILERHEVEARIADAVVHCIEHHRFRGESRPDTLEARSLFDADKLDSIGAVGIGRAFLFAGENGARLHNPPGTDPLKAPAYGPEDTAFREFLHKLRHVRERMLTKEGRRLAGERHAFMLEFFARFNREIEGKI
ncbi:MAG: HD domain-containing protein [Proteobacteria bacterium]|nr:HD domain-containing protein [Pseudomonadota bacterium]